MSYLNDVLLGVIEGITEFLPISSTGHLLLAEQFLGARSDAYNIVIQAGAILAVTLIYWRRLVGLVTAVKSDPVMSQVELQCGPFRVVSLISTEAVRELALEPGSVATAVIKATNVSIETARGRS